jgi:hypothetical protein
MTALEALGVDCSEFDAPQANSFVSDGDAPLSQ